MNQLTLSQQNALRTGLAYGLGLVLGSLIALLLFNTIQLKWVPINNPPVALAIGLILAVVIMSSTAGLAGYIGGYTLQNPTKSKTQRKLAFRSALSVGLPYGLLIFPIIFLISTMAFYDVGDVAIFSFAIFFLIMGAIYGIVVGLILGLSTVGRGFFSHVVEAGLVGFSLGGLALGICIYTYLSNSSARNPNGLPALLLLLGVFLFFGIGGFALGAIYSELTHKAAFSEPRPLTRVQKIRRGIYVSIALLLLFFIVRNFAGELADMLIPQDAHLTTVLNSTTIGTHWAEAEYVTEDINVPVTVQPDVFVTNDGQASLVWAQDGEIFWAAGNEAEWQAPIQVTNDADFNTAVPQTLIDTSGTTHLVWANGRQVWHSQCADGRCDEATIIAAADDNSCGSENDLHSAVLAFSNEQFLTAWSTGDGLAYASWGADEPVPTTATGCILETNDALSNLSLNSNENGRFALAFQADETILHMGFDAQAWTVEPMEVGEGTQPDILLDADNVVHVAWCNNNHDVAYRAADQTEIVSGIPCINQPQLGMDNYGRLHLIWYANQSQNQFSQFSRNHIIYETVLDTGVWQLAAVAQQPTQGTIPTMHNSANGNLHLAWVSNNDLVYAAQQQYQCDNTIEQPLSQLMLTVTERFQEPGEIVPYCNNRYDRFIIMPNPEPEYSDAPQTVNGGFDVMFDVARQAKYELLFSTMWYDRDQDLNSPGFLLAEAVADLYNDLQTNPEQYPRGLTVRILLGNPPEPTRAEFSDQMWSVLTDLHNAGVTEMLNEELGWRVEVGNFRGSLPHSHAKMMIVDGKTAVAAGYNMSYAHYPVDNPSGLGQGRFDLALQMTGPIAQSTHRAFDDIWSGATQRNCDNLGLPDGLWQETCYETIAISDHAPEVLKYYPTNSNSNAFSMYRSEALPESDRLVESVFYEAQQTIDAIHVNFTMPMICDLNLLYNICDYDDATLYLRSLIDAAENGTKVRLLLKADPFDGIESSVAIRIMQQEIEERGIEDMMEFRYFNGPMHAKSALIDHQFVVIGSQNLHYSAFGNGRGLVEYNLGTDDPEAITFYQNMFDYYWERANQ